MPPEPSSDAPSPTPSPAEVEESICERCGDRYPRSEAGTGTALCPGCVERVTPETEPIPLFKDPILSTFSLIGALLAGILIAILLVMVLVRPDSLNDRALPTFLICVVQVIVSIATEKHRLFIPAVWPIWLVVAAAACASLAATGAAGIKIFLVGLALGLIALGRAVYEPRYHLCDRRRLGLPEP